MSNILLYIFFGIEAIIGISTSAYILISLVWTIAKKIVNKIRTGASLYD